MVKKRPCFQLFLLGNIGEKNVLYHILERKNVFLGYKNKKFKTSKIEMFPQGLTHGFGPKIVICPPFFFSQYRPGKCFLWYSRTKKNLSRLQKQKFKKSKNWHFSRGVSPWFWSKNGNFFNFFFSQYRPEKCLLRYSRTKKRLSRL